MHIYIHGFASSGNATKGRILKEFYQGKENVITPDIPDEPFESIRTLDKLIKESNEPLTLWGSSLGGFYALYFTSLKNIKSILINPAIKPWIGLLNFVGKVKRHNSEEKFEWKKEYISQLEIIGNDIKAETIIHDNLTLLLAKDDSLLNFNDTLKYLDGHYKKLVLEEKAGHELMTFKEILEREF